MNVKLLKKARKLFNEKFHRTNFSLFFAQLEKELDRNLTESECDLIVENV